ncbi:putative cytochrome P450 [Lupinus albus]|uniref:Putative cytochrome P450 n=1 Tax=Lupinus albus TaxID=3870 RepID=A0A6A4P936_LUPAL|nr:putative cytochrome P450 [Lupinus albus]
MKLICDSYLLSTEPNTIEDLTLSYIIKQSNTSEFRPPFFTTMESEFFNFTTLISFSIFLIVALKLCSSLKKTDSTPNIPPGPWKLPILGNIPHIITSTPHRKLRDLAKIYGPLMHLQLGEVFTIIVSSAEYAKEIMKTHDIIFASRPIILASELLCYNSTNIVFSPYGNYWRQLRKICTLELFTPKRINSFKPIREEEFTNLINMIGSLHGSPINLTEAVLSSIYTITSRAAFGKKFKGQEESISLAKESVVVAGGFNIGDFFPSAKWLQVFTGIRPKLERLHQKQDRIMENVINEHKEAKSIAKEDKGEVEKDLVDVLLKFEEGNGINQDICLTKNNIKAILQDIFGGGGETSATTIDWAMAEMVRDPRVMKKAQAEVRVVFNEKERVDEIYINELKYLKLVVKETLRLHPAAPLLLPRECGQECEINGYHIPIKSKVIINAWAIGRDPNYWIDPERFYPERFIDSKIDYKGSNFEYIPFGAGRRICPGSTFGLMSVEMGLAFLLYHFDWKLPNGMKNEELDMTEVFGVTVRRKQDLYLIPIAFHSSLAT